MINPAVGKVYNRFLSCGTLLLQVLVNKVDGLNVNYTVIYTKGYFPMGINLDLDRINFLRLYQISKYN